MVGKITYKWWLQRAFFLSLGLVSLTGCGELLLNHDGKLDALDEQIRLERKRQELERLKQQNQPSTPAPQATASPAPLAPSAPVSLNQPPRIDLLSARLRTTVSGNDTVEIVASGSDPDGDPLEFTWASVFSGLSATRGEKVVWFPGGQQLAGRTNLITLTLSDKKGGTSTGTLNILIQNDGSLLVKENLTVKPLLVELAVSQPEPQKVQLRATGVDPQGGTVRYRWSSNRGLLSADQGVQTSWTPAGAESGQVVISLELMGGDGTARTTLDYRFERLADGSLKGDFRTLRNPLPVLSTGQGSTNTSSGNTQSQLQDTVYGVRQGNLIAVNLRTGSQQLLRPLESQSLTPVGTNSQGLWFLDGNRYLLRFDLADLNFVRQELPPAHLIQRGFMLQGQPLLLLTALQSSSPLGTLWRLNPLEPLSWKVPRWLLEGPLSYNGLVARVERNNLYFGNPLTGQESLVYSGTSNPVGGLVMAWRPDGAQLALLEGGKLLLFNTDGQKVEVESQQGGQQIWWSADQQHLLIKSGKNFYSLDSRTGQSQPLPEALSQLLSEMDALLVLH